MSDASPMNPRRMAIITRQFPLPLPTPPGEDYLAEPARMMTEAGWHVEFLSGPRAWRALRLRRYDLVHAHSHFPPALLAGMLTRRAVFTSHSYDLPRAAWKRRLLISLMNRFDRVIALSPFERDIYRAAGIPADRVVVLGLPVNVAFFSAPGHPTRWNLPQGQPVILFNANLRSVKNPAVVVAAFQRVRREFPEARLLIIGRDFMGRDYTSLPGVIFTDWQPAEVVRDALAAATVVVNSSSHESFSLSSFEAAAAGRPLCLPDLGSLRSLFGENALYHAPLDEMALAANMLRYLREPPLAAQHVAGNRKLVAQYDTARVLPEYVKLYESVAGR